MENNENIGPETNDELSDRGLRPRSGTLVERMFADLLKSPGETTGEESDENSNGEGRVIEICPEEWPIGSGPPVTLIVDGGPTTAEHWGPALLTLSERNMETPTEAEEVEAKPCAGADTEYRDADF